MGIKRTSINIEEELLKEVCNLSGNNNSNYAIKSALIVYKALLKDIQEGKNIIARDKDGKEVYYKFVF